MSTVSIYTLSRHYQWRGRGSLTHGELDMARLVSQTNGPSLRPFASFIGLAG